jgi:hypothetical protein
MRKAIIGALLGSALLITGVAPVLAETDAQLNVWCSIDTGSTLVDLQGTYVRDNTTTGPAVLTLWASSDGLTWVSTGKTQTVWLVLGQNTYPFKFGGALDASVWMDFKVSGGSAISRVVSRDECGFRVPEAPATPLLLIGALPAFALVAMKAAGIRLPLPNRNRIA